MEGQVGALRLRVMHDLAWSGRGLGAPRCRLDAPGTPVELLSSGIG